MDPTENLWSPRRTSGTPAMERDMDELDTMVEKYGRFLPELLDRLERELATSALSLWEGFVALCEDSMGVPAESVVAVVLEPVADRIVDLKSRAERLGLERRPRRSRR